MTKRRSQGGLAALEAALPAELRGTLCSAGELMRRRQVALGREHLTTGVPSLDGLLGGGLPRGALVELVGRGSCGRFAAVLATLAAATGAGETAALVDLGGQLDPRAAVAAGVQLERLLWLRPRWLPDAAAAAETLVGTGFAVVVLDAGLPPLRGRTAAAAWLRLARAAAGHDAAVLVAAPYRLSGPAARAVVTVGRGRPRWHGTSPAYRVLAGIETRLLLTKRRGIAPGETGTAAFLLPEAAATIETPRPRATEERRRTAAGERR